MSLEPRATCLFLPFVSVTPRSSVNIPVLSAEPLWEYTQPWNYSLIQALPLCCRRMSLFWADRDGKVCREAASGLCHVRTHREQREQATARVRGHGAKTRQFRNSAVPGYVHLRISVWHYVFIFLHVSRQHFQICCVTDQTSIKRLKCCGPKCQNPKLYFYFVSGELCLLYCTLRKVI